MARGQDYYLDDLQSWAFLKNKQNKHTIIWQNQVLNGRK